ncbi:hypothetical protein BH23PLA1_BH23PLA1_04260 [soil metagenome]
MNHILVGFRGLNRPGSTALGLFHTDSRRLRVLLEWPGGDGGIEALTASEDYLYIALQGPDAEAPSSLLTFDRQHLHLLGRDGLSGLGEIRSLLFHDGSLYVISAGTGEVVAYRADRGRPIGEPFRWKPDPNSWKAEVLQLDSLVYFNEELVVSGTTVGPDEGFLLSITRSEPIARGKPIGQPGSLAAFNGKLAYCEGSTGRLRVLNHPRFRHIEGQLRGLCQMDANLFVGSTHEHGHRLCRLSADDLGDLESMELPDQQGSISALLPLDNVSRWPTDPDRSWAEIPGRRL